MDPHRTHMDGDPAEPVDPRGPWERFVGVLTRPPRRRRVDWYAAVAVSVAALLNAAVVAGTADPATWQLVTLGILIAAALGCWADVLPDRWARAALPIRVVAAAIAAAAVLVWFIIAVS